MLLRKRAHFVGFSSLGELSDAGGTRSAITSRYGGRLQQCPFSARPLLAESIQTRHATGNVSRAPDEPCITGGVSH